MSGTKCKEANPGKEFTTEDKKKILELRKSGKSIKEIAKRLHFSDRRVSVYVNSVEFINQNKPKKAYELLRDKEKSVFKKYLYLLLDNSFSASTGFVRTLNNVILEEMREIMGQLKTGKMLSKKEIQKRTDKRLQSLMDTFTDALISNTALNLFSMPSRYKRFWLRMVDDDPKTVGLDCGCEVPGLKTVKDKKGVRK